MPRQTRAQQARSEIARSFGFTKISNPGPWKDMDSSCVVRARYDVGLEQIQVNFRDGTPYYYDGIPRNIWNNFRRTPSPGRYVNRVLNAFPYSRSPVDWDEFDDAHEQALNDIAARAMESVNATFEVKSLIDPLDDFVDLAEKYKDVVPGTTMSLSERRAQRELAEEEQDDEPAWITNPYYRYELMLKGEKTTFYTINALAEILGRQTGTVRRWESEGKIPKAQWRTKAEGAKGGKRLYTKAQLDRISALASAYRVRETKGSLPDEFVAKVADVFRRR